MIVTTTTKTLINALSSFSKPGYSIILYNIKPAKNMQTIKQQLRATGI